MPTRKKRPFPITALCVLFSASLLLCSLPACRTDEQESSLPAPSPSAGAEQTASPTPDRKPQQASSLEDGVTATLAGVEEVLTPAQARTAAPIYAQPAPGEAIAGAEAGQVFLITETDDPLWYSTTLENGAVGYLYAENLFRTDREGAASSLSLFHEYIEEKTASLKGQLPEGKYWNHMYEDNIAYGDETPLHVTDIPCEHDAYGELYCNFYNGATEKLFPYDTLCQCLGFASFLSDEIFGETAPFHLFYDWALLRVGDHIRLHEYEHSMTVIEIAEDYITVAEVNQDYEDCLISWSRQIPYYELDDLAWDSEYISRYPLCPDGDGGYVSWEDDFDETESY